MYQEGVEEYDDLQEYAEEETKNDAPAADGEKLATIDFKALQEINGEVVAWIRCEALGLDYPVVQWRIMSITWTIPLQGRSTAAAAFSWTAAIHRIFLTIIPSFMGTTGRMGVCLARLGCLWKWK